MARVHISIPDDVYEAVRAAGFDLSAIATAALRSELDRRATLAALDAHLADLEHELGPIPSEDADAARRWADKVLGPATTRTDTLRHLAGHPFTREEALAMRGANAIAELPGDVEPGVG